MLSVIFPSVVLAGWFLPPRTVMGVPIAQAEPAYVPDPQGRGTISLVTTCLVTLSLCVWTAIHLNIPRAGESWWGRHKSKAIWAALAVVAPEVVLWRAVAQWGAARVLYKEYNSIKHKDSGAQDCCLPLTSSTSTSPEPKIQKPADPTDWSLRHGFFAVMGGFTVAVPPESDWILNGKHTLTPRGVLLLARMKLLPNLRKETIKCRRKVSSLAKALVCVQAAWIVVETIARKASGLPITLLELHTLAHAGCALAMYVAWWYKPQDVEEPLTIDISPSVAALLSSSDLRQIFPISFQTEEKNNTDCGPWQHLIPTNNSGLRVIGSPSREFTAQEIEQAIKPSGIVMLLPDQSLEGLPFTCLPCSCPSQIHATPKHLDKKEVETLVLLSQILNEKESTLSLHDFNCRECRLTEEAANIKIRGNSAGTSKSKVLLLLALLNLLYGGIHATSWNSHFPTRIEQTIWRASAIIVGSSGAVGVAWNYLRFKLQSKIFHGWAGAKFTVRVNRWGVPILGIYTSFPYEMPRWKFVIFGMGWGTSVSILVIFNYLARMFLILEALISVRSLPIGAYATASWTNPLPHIG
jgi:hypothetical protein